jgi:hypothetical protein
MPMSRAMRWQPMLAFLLLAASASADELFPGRKFTVLDEPWRVAVADLNGDRIPDLVTADHAQDGVSVLLGTGGGSFEAPRGYRAGDGAAFVVTGDLDGDFRPDLVVANSLGGDISVLLSHAPQAVPALGPSGLVATALLLAVAVRRTLRAGRPSLR